MVKDIIKIVVLMTLCLIIDPMLLFSMIISIIVTLITLSLSNDFNKIMNEEDFDLSKNRKISYRIMINFFVMFCSLTLCVYHTMLNYIK